MLSINIDSKYRDIEIFPFSSYFNFEIMLNSNITSNLNISKFRLNNVKIKNAFSSSVNFNIKANKIKDHPNNLFGYPIDDSYTFQIEISNKNINIDNIVTVLNENIKQLLFNNEMNKGLLISYEDSLFAIKNISRYYSVTLIIDDNEFIIEPSITLYINEKLIVKNNEYIMLHINDIQTTFTPGINEYSTEKLYMKDGYYVNEDNSKDYILNSSILLDNIEVKITDVNNKLVKMNSDFSFSLIVFIDSNIYKFDY